MDAECGGQASLEGDEALESLEICVDDMLDMLSESSGIPHAQGLGDFDQSLCWGGQLKRDTSCCTHGFEAKPGHFKAKVCPNCLGEGIEIDVARLRAISESAHALFSNSSSAGLWCRLRQDGIELDFRLINHTTKCVGPWLVILRAPLPPLDDARLGLGWAEMPPAWFPASGSSTVKLVFAKGTFCPKDAVGRRRSKRQPSTEATTEHGGEAHASGASKRVAGDATAFAFPRDNSSSSLHRSWSSSSLSSQDNSFRSKHSAPLSTPADTEASTEASNLGELLSAHERLTDLHGRESSSSIGNDGGSLIQGFAAMASTVQPGARALPVAHAVASSSTQPYVGHLLSSFLPSTVAPTVQPGANMLPAAHGAASSAQPHVSHLLSSFLPSGLQGGRSNPAASLSRALPAPTETEEASAAATEDSNLLPSPPMSPPDPLDSYQNLPTDDRDPALPVALQPLTLRFFPPSAEAVWRAEHATSVQRFGTYVVCSQVAGFSVMGLAQANQAIRLWLMAWSMGWVPAALLLLSLREQHEAKHKADKPSALARSRLLDWGALSLCVLPQLILTLWTQNFDWGGTHAQLNGSDGSIGSSSDVSNGLLDSDGHLKSSGLLDPLDGDPLGGAGAMGRVLANWWFAHFQLHLNCTEPTLLMLAVALSAALASFQAPISVAPFQERLLVYKGFLGGQLSGYVFQRHLRSGYVHERRLMGTQRAKLTTGAATAHAATRLEPAKAGAARTASSRDWSQMETRMDSATLCFGSSALEASYRDFCFNQPARWWLECTYVSDIIFQLIDFISGHATLSESVRIITLQTVPLIGRAVVRRRGDRERDKNVFRHAYFVFNLLLLVVKLLLPSAAGGSNVDQWYFLLPFYLRLQGPRSIPLCWTMSVAAIALSKVSPPSGWRGDQSAEASAMRDSVVAAEIVAYLFDWQLRKWYLRAQASPYHSA